jgi:P2 family phage contractile tail tube protein
MTIQYPRVLKNMNLFVDGRGYAGRVNECTLPVLTLKTEEHRAGGMDMPVDLDMGMERLETTMVLSDFDPDIFRSFGLLDKAGLPVTIRGATQRQGEATVHPVVANMTGGWKQIDAGTWTPGEANTLTLTCTLSFFRLSIDDEELIEIDAVNMVRRINGTDQLAEQRSAIGL